MLKYLKLIRLPNLLIIPLVQYCMRLCIIKPIIELNGFELQLTEFQFLLLVISTVFLAAAGYVINDYFDLRIDLINRPQSVLVSKSISRRIALGLHIALNVIGVFAGLLLAYLVKLYTLGFIYFIIAGLFWYYSTTYKKQFLLGNLIVAFLASLVPLQVALYEVVLLNQNYFNIIVVNNYSFIILLYWVGAFAFFAFITNFIREIIKDLEDFEGDNIHGRNTFPITIGVFNTKLAVISLLLLTTAAIIYLYLKFLGDSYSLYYFIFLLFIPIIVITYFVIRAKSKKEYSNASLVMKIFMLTGICYAFLARYIIVQNF